MKLEFGDDIEISHLQWIREKLPTYEEIWSTFIGHNGKGQPLSIINLPESERENREKFYQAHYTLLHCFLQARDAVKRVDDMQAYVPEPNAYMAIQRELDTFLVNIGRARDMFKMMDSTLKLKGTVSKEFQDLYQKRCSVLHSTIPSQKIEDGILHLPDIAGNEKSDSLWHNESRWSGAANLNYRVAPEVLFEIFESLLSQAQGGLSSLLNQIKNLLSQYGAYIEQDPEFTRDSNSTTFSGVAYCYSSSLK